MSIVANALVNTAMNTPVNTLGHILVSAFVNTLGHTLASGPVNDPVGSTYEYSLGSACECSCGLWSTMSRPFALPGRAGEGSVVPVCPRCGGDAAPAENSCQKKTITLGFWCGAVPWLRVWHAPQA